MPLRAPGLAIWWIRRTPDGPFNLWAFRKWVTWSSRWLFQASQVLCPWEIETSAEFQLRKQRNSSITIRFYRQTVNLVTFIIPEVIRKNSNVMNLPSLCELIIMTPITVTTIMHIMLSRKHKKKNLNRKVIKTHISCCRWLNFSRLINIWTTHCTYTIAAFKHRPGIINRERKNSKGVAYEPFLRNLCYETTLQTKQLQWLLFVWHYANWVNKPN